jgi:RNA polymerase sigma factor for flagellar operon FliA
MEKKQMTQNVIELKDLWNIYFDVKNKKDDEANFVLFKEIEKRLVEHYYPIVRHVAEKLHMKLNQITVDELVSMGVDGLYDAISKFDNSRAIKFETYALYRIRGSMLDAIRKSDWIPRLVRSKASQIEKQKQLAESEVGHKLSNSELAAKMGITEKEFENIYKTAPAVHSVHELENEDNEHTIDYIDDHTVASPIEPMLRTEFFHKLMGKSFSPLERKIVWLYYFEDLTMHEISDTMQMSESRVSQIHNLTLKRLKNKALKNPQYFKDVMEMISGFKGSPKI